MQATNGRKATIPNVARSARTLALLLVQVSTSDCDAESCALGSSFSFTCAYRFRPQLIEGIGSFIAAYRGSTALLVQGSLFSPGELSWSSLSIIGASVARCGDLALVSLFAQSVDRFPPFRHLRPTTQVRDKNAVSAVRLNACASRHSRWCLSHRYIMRRQNKAKIQ